MDAWTLITSKIKYISTARSNKRNGLPIRGMLAIPRQMAAAEEFSQSGLRTFTRNCKKLILDCTIVLLNWLLFKTSSQTKTGDWKKVTYVSRILRLLLLFSQNLYFLHSFLWNFVERLDFNFLENSHTWYLSSFANNKKSYLYTATCY